MTPQEENRLAELKSRTSYSITELNEVVDLENQKMREEIDGGRMRWGRWKYNATEPPSIDLGTYEITLDRINTMGKLGDWLMHLADKDQVVTADDLGNLVLAVRDLTRIGYHSVAGRGVA